MEQGNENDGRVSRKMQGSSSREKTLGRNESAYERGTEREPETLLKRSQRTDRSSAQRGEKPLVGRRQDQGKAQDTQQHGVQGLAASSIRARQLHMPRLRGPWQVSRGRPHQAVLEVPRTSVRREKWKDFVQAVSQKDRHLRVEDETLSTATRRHVASVCYDRRKRL